MEWNLSSFILLLLLSNVFAIVLVAIVILYLLSINIELNLDKMTLFPAAGETKIHWKYT